LFLLVLAATAVDVDTAEASRTYKTPMSLEKHDIIVNFTSSGL
jgi:hypothetical protein